MTLFNLSKLSDEDQVKRMEIFTKQIDTASEKLEQVLILGEANLCYLKWNLEKFKYKKVAELLKSALESNGLTVRQIVKTFTADIVQKNGNIASSAIDHIYVSEKYIVQNIFSFIKVTSVALENKPFIHSFIK